MKNEHEIKIDKIQMFLKYKGIANIWMLYQS